MRQEPLISRHWTLGAKSGDIIVSSGATWIGNVIRAVTSSQVSHVMIYLGRDGLGAERDELFAGLAGSISDSALEIAKRCYPWIGQAQLNVDVDNSLSCSEFVSAAYEVAGIVPTSEAQNWSDPQDIAELYWRGRLGYVGHLFS